jgi:hypothetical protein
MIKVWIACTIVSILFNLGLLFANTFIFSTFLVKVFAMSIGYELLEFYLCYIVYYYVRDLEFEILMDSAFRTLTDQEISEFEHGLDLHPNFDHKTKNLIDSVRYQGYKREEFEIPIDRLEMGS